MLHSDISLPVKEEGVAVVVFNCAVPSGYSFDTFAAVDGKFSNSVARCTRARHTPPLKTQPDVVEIAVRHPIAENSGKALAPQAETIASLDPALEGSGFVPTKRLSRYRHIFSRVGATYAIDPRFLSAIMHVESRGNAMAISRTGARGLMQVMPGTAVRFGVANPRAALHDPDTNITVAARYLAFLRGMLGDRTDLVLAAYNAGEGAVLRYGRSVPPYQETRAYVRDVLIRYRALLADDALG